MTVASQDWTTQAKCRGTGDALFPEPAEQRRVRAFCSDCPVRARCLAEALDHQLEWGVWGGRTERERRALLRRHPDVTSWIEVLCGPASSTPHALAR